MMNFDFDDPRLTAFALGELDDADKQDIERLLADHPEAALQVDQIRQTARWLSEGLHEEQARESAAIAAAPAAASPVHLVPEIPPPAPTLPWWRRPGSLGPIARIAAFLMIGTLFGGVFFLARPREVRHVDEADVNAERSPSQSRWAYDTSDQLAVLESAEVKTADSLTVSKSRQALPAIEAPRLAKQRAKPEAEVAEEIVARNRRFGREAGDATVALGVGGAAGAVPTPTSSFGTIPAAGAPASGPMSLALNAPKPGQAPRYNFGDQARGPDQNALVPALTTQSNGGGQSEQTAGRRLYRGESGQQAGEPGQQSDSVLARGTVPQDQKRPGLSAGSRSLAVASAEQESAGTLAKELKQKADAAKTLKDQPQSMFGGQASQGQVGRLGQLQGQQGQVQQGQADLYSRGLVAMDGLEASREPSNSISGADRTRVASASEPTGLAAGDKREQLERRKLAEAEVVQGQPMVPAPKAAQPVELAGRADKEQGAVTTFQDIDAAAIADPQAAPMPPAAQPAPAVEENPFVLVGQEPTSTFAIDVDTASYTIVRRTLLQQNQLPAPGAVRIEEMLNYFPYQDAPPAASSPDPFAIHVETARCPWNAGNRLARIGIAGKPIAQEARKPSNIVFLVDVSGSMDQPNKLPLVQFGLRKLVEQLGENDRVAIAVYAGSSGLVLPPTSCLKKAEILSRIEEMKAGGSTNGGAGIQLAYDQAAAAFIHNGVNRVILATDGDFNVGVTNQDELVRLVESRAKGEKPIFLTVLGFGMDNLKDSTLEKLADKGNGHYAYIDGPEEAYKVLVEELGATLEVIAKDVKIQVEFMPERVKAYRLIGYENRVMPNEDFANDQKDGGEIGAGHHVTALYEIVPAAPNAPAAAGPSTDSFVVRLRCKKPGGTASALIERPVTDRGLDYSEASDDFKFASSVAGFGMLLRRSPSVGSLTYSGVIELASPTLAHDPSGYRREFLGLVQKARDLASPGEAAR